MEIEDAEMVTSGTKREGLENKEDRPRAKSKAGLPEPSTTPKPITPALPAVRHTEAPSSSSAAAATPTPKTHGVEPKRDLAQSTYYNKSPEWLRFQLSARGIEIPPENFTGKRKIGGKTEIVDQITKQEMVDKIFELDGRHEELKLVIAKRTGKKIMENGIYPSTIIICIVIIVLVFYLFLIFWNEII